MTDSVGQAALERAIDRDNLLLVYQPIHDTLTRRIVAAEALVRQRRESGEIREASVIAEAAENGPDLFLFDSITTRMAFDDAAQWQRQAPGVRLNVNLSPREFQEGNVLPRLRSLVDRCSIDTHRINLEITETSYIDHPDQTVYILKDLKDLGLQIWLDDFGTGHSSLEHLQKFPLDGLKIPAGFIKEIPADYRSRAITRALIALSHELELKVIAEGIEHEEQLAFLTDAGCDYIQGFLFSKPMPVEELEELLERSHPGT
ncbi:MAG: sensor-containing diguanylate cyclase/phosphodiesterase [Acidobacteria bacterium]|nr:sensor-containing diguanylate cyclase/phosphodiesterase [Acidobacteriota bacterium]